MPRDDDELCLTIAERRLAGQDLRKLVPRGRQAEWQPPTRRPDPVQCLIETGRHRIPALLPVRYGRMRASPLAFLRGAAAVMAADLAHTPASGLRVQACGDCHLMNFGVAVSPEGAPVFDLNDFDETLPAPFEWDVKRLATSFALAGRAAGAPDKASRMLARTAALAYRLHVAELLRLSPLDAWRSRVAAAELLDGIDDPKLRHREERRLRLAAETSSKGFPRLIERRPEGLRIRPRPPDLMPLGGQRDDAHEQAARAAFDAYKATLPEERHMLVDRFRLVDVAFKMVGIGSVGTFCAIGLFATADGDPLLLQLKEAERSVLAPFAGDSVYRNQGQRVVTGQRMLQATPDIFLGWTNAPGDDRHCYVRQLKDQRLAAIAADPEPASLPRRAQLCGRTLARAHARSGDVARMVGYMGSGGAFDAAIADFALAYAEQTERDWRLFLDAIRAGWIEAAAP